MTELWLRNTITHQYVGRSPTKRAQLSDELLQDSFQARYNFCLVGDNICRNWRMKMSVPGAIWYWAQSLYQFLMNLRIKASKNFKSWKHLVTYPEFDLSSPKAENWKHGGLIYILKGGSFSLVITMKTTLAYIAFCS